MYTPGPKPKAHSKLIQNYQNAKHELQIKAMTFIWFYLWIKPNGLLKVLIKTILCKIRFDKWPEKNNKKSDLTKILIITNSVNNFLITNHILQSLHWQPYLHYSFIVCNGISCLVMYIATFALLYKSIKFKKPPMNSC